MEDFIGLWEMINNKNFNRIEFEAFKKELSLLNAEANREKFI